ncbi:hypothetical protein FY557_19265 [Chryseobacterium sp. SN22]|uniref:hypothetical protein n=1 Tax=Chryseobacterium sp. SN22 TaxID=2606431 RepID=UPI0011EFE328|nr:hypothetical protein [Chryseobacterium sp. SN22]KAA0126065.1 hypothetical protein FY557_19265 [Chryseobacterium sp. SN22]
MICLKRRKPDNAYWKFLFSNLVPKALIINGQALDEAEIQTAMITWQKGKQIAGKKHCVSGSAFNRFYQG